MLAFISLTASQSAMAQQEGRDLIEWKVAVSLPASKNGNPHFGVAGAATGVHNDVLIVGGGANFPERMPWLGGKKKYHNEVYVFQKDRHEFLKQFPASFKLPFHLAYSANCATPKGVFVGGGEAENGVSNKAFLMQWDRRKKKIIYQSLPDLPVALTNASATSDGSIVFLAGGENAEQALNSFYALDLNNIKAGWKTLPPLPKAISHAVLIAQSNKEGKSLYLAGGRKKNTGSVSTLYASVYAYDVKQGAWIEKQPLPYALSAGTGVVLGDSGLLLLGGDKGTTFSKTEALIAAIAQENDPVKKEALVQEKNSLQAAHPGFSNEVLLYNTHTNVWTPAGTIPFDVPVTTTAIPWGNCIIIPSGEIKAGVRTPQILAGHLKAQ